jgi:hypothetical protein
MTRDVMWIIFGSMGTIIYLALMLFVWSACRLAARADHQEELAWRELTHRLAMRNFKE